jgi:predicted nuclease of restriction endonuclease-like (RecB) superfamily
MTLPMSFEGYDDFLREVKLRIQQARQQAIWSVNRELVLLYWHIGHDISTRMRERGWGAKVVDRLAADLRAAFPDVKGFSVRNLKYMHGFAVAYPNIQIVQQVAAQLPWFHLCMLLDKVKDPIEREWYINEAVRNGWSRNVLVHQIESGLYQRQGQAVTNFARTLPAP